MNDMTELKDEEIVDEEVEEEILDEEKEGEENEAEIEHQEGDEEKEGIDDEVEVTIGDEKPEEVKDSSVIKDFRKRERENARRIRELEDKLKEVEAPKEIESSPEPTLEDADIDYDPQKYKTRLLAWNEEQRAIEDKKKQKLAQEEEGRKAWNEKLETYEKAKKELKVKDFEDAEEEMKSLFSVAQRGIIIDVTDNPALIIYALRKYSVKAKELASITHLPKFAAMIGKLEEKLKVTQKKAPPPEKVISNTGGKSTGGDSTLERLRAQAEKSGDYSKVMEYKRSKKK